MTGRQTGAAQLSPPKERAHTAGGWSPGLDSSSRPPSHPAYRTVTYLGACHPYSREAAADSHRIPNESNRYRLLIHLSAFIIAARPPPVKMAEAEYHNFLSYPSHKFQITVDRRRVFYIISYTIERSGYAGCSKPAVLHFRVGVGLTSDAWRAS